MRQRIILFALVLAAALLASPLMVQAPANNYWFDTSWHFRVNFTISNTDYSRDYWPAELPMNFTDLIRQAGKNGTFDYASVRVVEQNSSGGVMHQLKYQLENSSDFSATANAAGTLVFVLNGTFAPNQARYVYVYFDILENGAKAPISFASNLNYSWDGKEAQVNNSIKFIWKISTITAENVSGIYDVRAWDGGVGIIITNSTGRAVEYIQYSNGTHNFSFDFRNNATFFPGPVRLVMEQSGNETFWNSPDSKTGLGTMKKRYIFYDDVRWMKISQNFTNIGQSSITRNSTPAGALSINDLSYNALSSITGNESNPMSRYGASSGASGAGVIELNHSSNANFSAAYDSGLDRIGITLNTATIAPQESITQTAVLQFDDINYNDPMLLALRNQFLYPPIIAASNPEPIPYSFAAGVNHTLFNRNETVLVRGNTVYDPYDIVSSMNATIDMGTADTSDDANITLYDDSDPSHGDLVASDSIFSNIFNLSGSSATGGWNVTIRAYDAGGILISQNNTVFNVTNSYNASLNISNPSGYVERLINATIIVKNARQDGFIGGAELNCSYGAEELTNITDYNNGTYLLNFTAPSTTGSYALNCSASKANNTGWDVLPFYTETSETEMSLDISPENHTSPGISLSAGDSFNISVNTTDIGGANAKAVNISLSLPQNLSANSTFQPCGDTNMGISCIKQFTINVSNSTTPGNYTLNATVTWLNPIGSTNTTNTSFTTYILSNPLLNATPAALLATVADGNTAGIGNFTVRSLGNDNITNVIYNVTGLDNFLFAFSPQNISALGMGGSRNVSINVTVPLDYAPGVYNGTINVSSENGGWNPVELNITVPSTTAMLLSKTPQNYTSSTISVLSNETFNITINTTTIGIANAKDVNITLSLPQNLSANSTLESCGSVNISNSCIKKFNITIESGTPPGNYTFNITSTWRNPDATTNSTAANFTILVLPNPILNVSEGGISTILPDNSSIIAGNFTAYSIGNDNLTNVAFSVVGLDNFTITFSPANIFSMEANANQTVVLNVSVPYAHSPGNYTGTINVSSASGGWKTVELNVSVLVRREWNISRTSCEKAENPETGTVCLLQLSNTGNTPINITVDSYNTSYTYTNQTNMTLDKNSTQNIAFLYNVTNITKIYYFENYTINATDPDAVPQYYNFDITLIPYIVPLFSISVTPNETEQNNNIEISVNVTDRSGTGINWTILNLTLPNGTVESHNMSSIEVNGTVSRWYLNYSGNMSGFINYSLSNISNYTGSTLSRGMYNITIYSRDNTGVIGETNLNFTIYAKLFVGFSSGSTKYFQGSKWSLYYTITDAEGTGLEGANVTIALKDPLGNMSYEPYFQKFTVSSNGQILPVPEYSLPSDARAGSYNITANMTYYDAIAGKALTSFNNASFLVQAGSSGGGGGLTADIDTAVVWYPDNVMRFEMWFSYAGNVTDPDNMTLYVYDPASNLYFNIALADANRTAPGLYHYKYAMPVNTASGYYFAILTASKEGFVSQKVKPFRVAKGGPYDVRLTIIPPLEVPRSDYVNFEIFLENMGEVTQDVYIDYWVSYENQTFYYGGEAILTPTGENKTVARNAYIFSNQPLGINTLNLKVTYDSVQAPIILNATFEVIDEDIEIPPPPETNQTGGSSGGGSGGGGGWRETIIVLPPKNVPPEEAAKAVKEAKIDIESHNKEINIVRGWSALESVKVKSMGGAPLTNVTLSLTGIPTLWYTITPKNYESLPPGNNTVFLVEFKIPTNVDSGSYGLTFTARSKESIDEAVGRLVIFTSIEELVNRDIMNLKIELGKLQDDTDFSEKLGKDVSPVRDIISQAQTQIRSAEDNVKKKSFDDSLQNTQTASGLIKRGKRLLETAIIEKEAAGKPAENVWVSALKILLIIMLIASIALWTLRSKGKLNTELLQKYLKHEKNINANEDRKKELSDERAKIERMVKLLESELKEGIITESAYNELKKRNEEKLARIDKELKKLGG